MIEYRKACQRNDTLAFITGQLNNIVTFGRPKFLYFQIFAETEIGLERLSCVVKKGKYEHIGVISE